MAGHLYRTGGRAGVRDQRFSPQRTPEGRTEMAGKVRRYPALFAETASRRNPGGGSWVGYPTEAISYDADTSAMKT
jgi:hypothetical protein